MFWSVTSPSGPLEKSLTACHIFGCFSWSFQRKHNYFTSFFLLKLLIFSLAYFHQLETSKQSSGAGHSFVPESHGNLLLPAITHDAEFWLDVCAFVGVRNFIMLMKYPFSDSVKDFLTNG